MKVLSVPLLLKYISAAHYRGILRDHLIEFFSKIAKNDSQIANIELEDKPFCEVKALYETICVLKLKTIGCYVHSATRF